MTCRLFYLVGQLSIGALERQLSYLLQAMDRERYRPAAVVWNFCEKDAYDSCRRYIVRKMVFTGYVLIGVLWANPRARTLEPVFAYFYSNSGIQSKPPSNRIARIFQGLFLM